MPPQQQPPYGPAPQQPLPPQAPTPQPTPEAASPYDFIVNPPQQKRPSPLSSGPKGLLFIVGAAALILILIVVIFSALSGGGKDSTPFLRVAQEQQEMARVADLQYTSLQQESTKQFAENTKLTMQTDESRLITLLGQNGIKLADKQLALGINSQTDTTLTQSMTTNSLDPTLVKILQEELKAYQQSLQAAYSSTSSQSARTLLRQFNTNAQLLLTQSQQQ